MSNDHQVHVRFPDKMEVESPKTDKLIDSLIQAFKSLSTMLQDGFRQIADALQTLKQLPDLVTGLRADMNRQLTTLFQHEMEAQIHTRHANILTLDKKREATAALQEEKSMQLPKDRSRITDRYSRLLDDVATQSTRQVRQLDGHAFDLLEQIYPRQVQERFSYESMPVFEFLADHAADAADARAACLDEGLASARASVEQYLARRLAALAHVEALLGPGELRPGWYELPVLVAEVENQNTGERELRLVTDPGTSAPLADAHGLLARFHPVVAREAAAAATSRRMLPSDDQALLSQVLARQFGVPPEERERFEAQVVACIGTAEGAQ